ncbi:MAG: polysaccharide deacetylase family protein [Desulfobacteraceae bacterium]|nr:polysaccharide deacetylase family protein [Desulfobacteraceae bacterium]MCF8112076.1 polysaccharide deacetylase family protein [Desulfobacteraceae bacterium]
MNLQMAVKSRAASLFYKVGGFELFCRQISRSKAFVLMYHRVLEDPRKEHIFVQPGMYVRTETFRRHMAFLKSRFHVLPLSELIARIEAGKSVGKCCAVTFDDGWLDTWTQAYPVLREFNLPCAVFMATNFIGSHRIFWPEEAAFYLQQPGVVEAGRHHRFLGPFLTQLQAKGEAGQWLDYAITELKTRAPQERAEIIDCLRDLSGAGLPGRLLMGWDEARQMRESGLVEFGAHSHNHVILDQVPLAGAEKEILQSKAEMERQLGVTPALFAYPNGNYTSDLKALLKKNGFKAAVTTRKGWFDRRVSLFEMPRIGMHEDVSRTAGLFAARIFLKWM